VSAVREFPPCLPLALRQSGARFLAKDRHLRNIRDREAGLPASFHISCEYLIVTKLYVGNLPFTATGPISMAALSKSTRRRRGMAPAVGIVDRDVTDACDRPPRPAAERIQLRPQRLWP